MADWYCDEVIPNSAAFEKLIETPHTLAFRPPIPGFGQEHIILIPKQHVASLQGVDPASSAFVDLVEVLQGVVRTVVEAHGGCQVLTTVGTEQHNRHLHWRVAVGDGVARFISATETPDP